MTSRFDPRARRPMAPCAEADQEVLEYALREWYLGVIRGRCDEFMINDASHHLTGGIRPDEQRGGRIAEHGINIFQRLEISDLKTVT